MVEGGEVSAGFPVEGDIAIELGGGGVAHVAGVAVVAGDVPAAPAGFDGAGVVDEGSAGLEERGAVFVREDRADHDAGDVVGHAAAVAVHADFGAVEARGGAVWAVGVEGVEDWAEVWVEARELDETAGDPADVGVVAEVDGAGVGGSDAVFLDAGFGEDEDLGGFGDGEFGEDAAEEGFGVGGVDGEAAGLEGGVEGGAAVVEGGGEVVVGGFLVFDALGSCGGGGGEGRGGGERDEEAHGRTTRRGAWFCRVDIGEGCADLSFRLGSYMPGSSRVSGSGRAASRA